MITSRIRIEGDSTIYDMYQKFGFIYKDSDTIFSPPEKKRDSTSYAEEHGEHSYNKTVYDAFDYNVSFVISTPNRNLLNANSKVKAFNDAIRSTSAVSDVLTCKTVEFYNDYKRCKIVGIPEVIETAKTFYRRSDGSVLDCAEVSLKIHVTAPLLCEFDMND